MRLEELEKLSTPGTEAEIARGIINRIASRLPELDDHSPSSPHVVIAESVAWGSGLIAEYALQMPQLVEEWLLRELFSQAPYPARAAQGGVLVNFSTSAGIEGRTIPAGTIFYATGISFTSVENFFMPPGSDGSELDNGQYRYLIPVSCSTPGPKGNLPPGSITRMAGALTALMSVSNPYATSDGRDEEVYSELRQRAFRSPLGSSSLITHQDFEEAVVEFLSGGLVGIVTPPPVRGFIHLTILNPDGTALSENLPLQTYLESRCPFAPILFVPPIIVDIGLLIQATFDSTVTRSESLEANIRSVLQAELNPASWSLWGQERTNRVVPSELIRLLQELPGMVSIDVISPADDIVLPNKFSVPRLASLDVHLSPL